MNKTEESLFFITKDTDIMIEQAKTKPQETLEFKRIKTSESFSFEIPMELENEWMLGITSLEVFIFALNIKENLLTLMFLMLIWKKKVNGLKNYNF